MNHKRTVLVTGGCGYVGSHTAIKLIESGFDVVIIDNLSNSTDKTIARINDITGVAVKFYNCDILDIETVKSILIKYNVKSVMHFAGLKSVPDSINDPLSYYTNNVTGTVDLLRAIDSSGIVENIVFSSSATVYGKSTNVPLVEDEPCHPISPYGFSKLWAEQIIHDYCANSAKTNYAILRYFNPAGAHESGLIGELPKGTPGNLIPFVSFVAAGIKQYVSIYGDDYETPDGTGIRDYIHVCDLAEGHICALDYVMEKRSSVLLNLGTGKGYSVNQVIDEFRKASKSTIPAIYSDRRVGDLAVSYANISKANEVLRWFPKLSLSDMCLSQWRWMSTNFPKD